MSTHGHHFYDRVRLRISYRPSYKVPQGYVPVVPVQIELILAQVSCSWWTVVVVYVVLLLSSIFSDLRYARERERNIGIERRLDLCGRGHACRERIVPLTTVSLLASYMPFVLVLLPLQVAVQVVQDHLHPDCLPDAAHMDGSLIWWDKRGFATQSGMFPQSVSRKFWFHIDIRVTHSLPCSPMLLDESRRLATPFPPALAS